MLKLLIKLSALILSFCYVTVATTEDLSQLTERMNRMINSLYSPSTKTALPKITDTPTTPAIETPAYSYPAASPQLFYVAPPVFPPPAPFYLDSGVQPFDYGYPGISNPFPRPVFPAPYNYDLGYRPVYPPYPYPPPYHFPTVPKPNDFYPYPEHIQHQHRTIPPPMSPPPYHAPYPIYAPPYQSIPPSYPANFAPYPPNTYAKPRHIRNVLFDK